MSIKFYPLVDQPSTPFKFTAGQVKRHLLDENGKPLPGLRHGVKSYLVKFSYGSESFSEEIRAESEAKAINQVLTQFARSINLIPSLVISKIRSKDAVTVTLLG